MGHSDMNVTPALTAGLGSETSGTFNISYRQGALGDWLYDRFIQPYYDIQYNQMQEQHYRRMTEILHTRNNSGQGGSGSSGGGYCRN
jgi:hypothetical protein